MSDIVISEIFGPTIQGEGALIGRPTVFVRVGGCDFRCHWCDTLYAVDKRFRRQWRTLDSAAIMAEVQRLSHNQPLLVTLSGGNPAMQPLGELISTGQALGYTFAIETQGSIAQDWFAQLDTVTLSPKPPSSKMAFDKAAFDRCIDAAAGRAQLSIKIVIDDKEDLAWCADRREEYPHVPFILQPCNTTSIVDAVTDTTALNAKLRWLVDQVTRRRWFNVTVLPQLHVQLWGNQRGV